MQFVFSIFALILSQFFLRAEEPKVVDHRHKPSDKYCPADLATAATKFMVESLCLAVNERDVPLIQGGIIKGCSTIHIKNFDPIARQCVNQGVKPYLQGMIPFLTNHVHCDQVKVLTTVLEDGGNVMVIGNLTTSIGPFVAQSRFWATFEPTGGEGSCQYRIADQKLFNYLCL